MAHGARPRAAAAVGPGGGGGHRNGCLVARQPAGVAAAGGEDGEPRNYRYTDYAGIAVSLDAWLFDKAPPELGLWCAGSAAGRSASYTGPAWGIPSYAGADRAPCNIQGPCLDKWEPGEGIPLMGSLLAAAYFGIDKSLPVAALNGSSLFDSVFLYVGGAADLPLVSDHVLWPGQAMGVAGSSW